MAVDMNKLVNLDRLKEFQTSENASTASEFSTSKSYAAGAYVYYKGKLYKFKSAHAAGAWTTTDVEEAKLADDVSCLKESIAQENLFAKFNAQVLTYTGGENSYNDGVTEILTNKNINSQGQIVDGNSINIIVIPVYDLTAKYTLLAFNSNNTVYTNQTSQVVCLDSAKTSLGFATAVTGGVTIPYPTTMFLGFRISSTYLDRGAPMVIKNWDGVNKTAYVPYTPTVPVITDIAALQKSLIDNSVFNAYAETVNLMNLATVVDNAVIANNGTLSENNEYDTSDFIPVTAGENYIGNFTNHLAWYTDDKTLISRSNQVYSATAPSNAAFARIDWDKAVIPSDKIMFIKGTELPDCYIPHLIPIYSDKLTSQWMSKVWAVYGDSITAISNGDALTVGWAKYVNDEIPFGAFHGRGVGSQKFSWGTNGGSVVFVNANTGAYINRNDSYNKDNYTGDVPSGSVAIRGAFCSWDRITHMFPESIKDTIDMIFIMGSTNDSNDDTDLAWVPNDNTDTEWAASTYYATYGGDYNIATLAGGVASTIMKMQAWMPQATIIIASAFNGQTLVTGGITPATIPNEYEKSEIVMQTARKFGCPQVDVFGTCNVNVLNSPTYISDGTHPDDTAGYKALARAVIMGIKNIYPLA